MQQQGVEYQVRSFEYLLGMHPIHLVFDYFPQLPQELWHPHLGVSVGNHNPGWGPKASSGRSPKRCQETPV